MPGYQDGSDYQVGIASDFVIYPEQFFSGMVEVLQTNFALFNGASASVLSLITEGHIGDYTKKSFVKHTPGLIQERNNLSNDNVKGLIITHGEYQDIKVNRRIGPVDYTLDEFVKLGENPELASFQIGQMMGPQVAEDYAKAALASVQAAIESVDDLNIDNSDKTLATSMFVDMMRPLGDAASRIKAWVMHSKPYFDLVQGQIADKLFDLSVAIVYGGSPATFGKPVIVSDIDSLLIADPDGTGVGVTTYPILGLVDGAAVVKESEGRRIANKLLTGRENLYQEIQGEYAYNVGVKSFSYVANAGNNPSLATLANKTSWAKFPTVADYLKLMPGTRMLVK